MPRNATDFLDADHDLHIPLPDAPSEIQPHAVAVGRPTPSYAALYRLVVNGDLPAIRIGRSRYFEREKLPEILEKLGLVPGTGKKSSKARTAPVAPVRDTVAA